jgi:hypothetical protein
MLHVDDEPTTFEHAPLGARQRLIPSATFVSKRAQFALGSGAQPVITDEVAEQTLAADELVIAEQHDFDPPTSAWLLLARSIDASRAEPFEPGARHFLEATPDELRDGSANFPTTPEWLAVARAVESSSGWVVSSESSTMLVTSSSTGLPVRRRRDRLSILALAVLGLLLLGGAALPPDRIDDETPVVELGAQIDRVLPSVWLASYDEVPPITEEIEPAPVVKKIARKIVRKPVARPRKITVDASSALGGLRPKRAW